MSNQIKSKKERKVVTAEELNSVVLGAVYGKGGLTRAQADGDEGDGSSDATNRHRNPDEDEGIAPIET